MMHHYLQRAREAKKWLVQASFLLFAAVVLGYSLSSTEAAAPLYTLPAGEDFYLVDNVVAPAQEVVHLLGPGDPPTNSGGNFQGNNQPGSIVTSSLAPYVPAPQIDVSVFSVEGFLWNENWGWISLSCTEDPVTHGYDNRGIFCGGEYETYILPMPGLIEAKLTGNAYSERIGQIDFMAPCPPPGGCASDRQVTIDLTTGKYSGFAWNDHVGWLFLEGHLSHIPNIIGTCGDGTTEGTEQCDDGNTDKGDGCNQWCQIEECGDNYVDYDGPDNVPGTGDEEACDDGGAPGGCTDTCELPPTVCGDGVWDVGPDGLPNTADDVEACDDGDTTDAGACLADCSGPTYCGDGTFQPINGMGQDEYCDDGGPSATCTALCKPKKYCGDGLGHAPNDDGIMEQCDDGLANSFSGPCTPTTCEETYCGDGIRQNLNANGDYEECEPRNSILANGDYCNMDCQIEVASKGPTLPDAEPPECGDAVTGPNEECDYDDPNLVLPPGYFCADGTNYPECTVIDGNAVCGNGGAPEAGEECDDGNNDNGDGCDEFCFEEEIGTYCGDGFWDIGPDQIPNTADDVEECDNGPFNDDAGTCTTECVSGPFSICPDGFPTGPEECDDGNMIDGDECSNSCTLNGSDGLDAACVSVNDCEDVLYMFESIFGFLPEDPSLVCAQTCGDGFRNPDSEECDDGNTVDGDGCSSSCVDETIGAICGNGIEEIGETCDDGGNVSGDGCDASCFDEDQIVCFDSLGCEEMFDAVGTVIGVEVDDSGYCGAYSEQCGNGVWPEPGEECDWSVHGIVNCTFSCEYAPYVGYCGDGYRQGEECDDGNNQPGDGCSPSCEWELDDPALEPACNDPLEPFWDYGEECDPAYPDMDTYIAPATCSPYCELIEPGAVCGNGSQELGEGCDDGNIINGDGCSDECEPEEPVATITCYPTAETVKWYDPTRGDVYDLDVALNCLEEPNNWVVSVQDYLKVDTVDCQQTDSILAYNDSNVCTSEDPTPVGLRTLTGPEYAPTTLAEIWSQAPTGYSCPLDDDNNYDLEQVLVRVQAGAAILYEDWVDVDRTLSFTPYVLSNWFTHDGGPYLDLNYLDYGDFDANVLVYAAASYLSAGFQLDVDSDYRFLFDIDGDGIVDPANPVDANFALLTYTNMIPPVPVNLVVGADYGVGPVPLSQIVQDDGIDYGPALNESADLYIAYVGPSELVMYCADSLPDMADMKIVRHIAQIKGPVNTDQLYNNASYQDFVPVGSVGESVRRKDIMRNVAKYVDRGGLIASGFSMVDLNSSLNMVDGDHLSYEIEDYEILYFRGNVEFSTNDIEGLTNDQHRVIVVEGGDVYINDDIDSVDVAPGERSSFELVVLQDPTTLEGGNVYVAPGVVYVEGNIYADGALFPYDGTSIGAIPDIGALEAAGHLDNQFVLRGSLVSNNTIGGVDDPNGPFDGNGNIAASEESARSWDLNYFRMGFGLVPGAADDVGNPYECNNQGSLDIGDAFYESPTCESGDPATSDLIPSGLVYEGLGAGENYPVYILYQPPSEESPIFDGGINVNVGE